MSQAPSPTGIARGYDSPQITQFNVFMPNRVGRMLELVKGFEEQMVRVCAINVLDSSDHAVIRLVTSNAAAARAILKEHGLSFMEGDILVVNLDGGHTLSQMCQHLLSAELNIRFAYPMFGWATCNMAIALAVDDMTLASQILRRKEFRLLGEADLPKWGE